MRLRRRARVQVVTFVTREGCTLCEEALPVVRRVAGRAGAELVVADVDADPALEEQWSDHVPVVLLDGVEHSRWWVDQALLAKALGVRV
jgi:glutaredoxin